MSTVPSFPEQAETDFRYRGARVVVRVDVGAVSEESGVENYKVTCDVYGQGTDRMWDEPDRGFHGTADTKDTVEETARRLVETATDHIDEQAELCGTLQTALTSACAPYEEGGDHSASSAE